jgi:hypothetical protein
MDTQTVLDNFNQKIILGSDTSFEFVNNNVYLVKTGGQTNYRFLIGTNGNVYFEFKNNNLYLIGKNGRFLIGTNGNVKLDIDNNNLYLIGENGRLLIGNINNIKLNFAKESFLSIGNNGLLKFANTENNISLDQNYDKQFFLNINNNQLFIGNPNNVDLLYNKSNILLRFYAFQYRFFNKPYTLSEINFNDMKSYLSKTLNDQFKAINDNTSANPNIQDTNSRFISINNVSAVSIAGFVGIVGLATSYFYGLKN